MHISLCSGLIFRRNHRESKSPKSVVLLNKGNNQHAILFGSASDSCWSGESVCALLVSSATLCTIFYGSILSEQCDIV